MRIGILGGTFDPIHNGHLALAQAALVQLKLARLIFVPAFLPPLKPEDGLSDPKVRLEMVKCAVGGEARFEVSDCEIKRGGISYTVDTLREFRRQYPEPHELFFVTGGDWGQSLDRWKEIGRVFELAHFVVAKRPGFDVRRLPPQVEFLDFVPLDISATAVRERVKRGESVSSIVPESVVQYIRAHKLYLR